MADLAITFHWPPSVMDRMEVAELLRWHEHAVARMPKKSKG